MRSLQMRSGLRQRPAMHCSPWPVRGSPDVARDGNRRFYESRFIGARYARQSGLQPAEAAIIERYRRQVSGARILDLGVGGGRTTAFLAPLAGDYVGVDYSREMVERCRKRFPAARFEIADAADLSRFADASFD